MKTETIFLGSIAAKAKAITLINEIDINGAVKVVISDATSRSSRQNALYWKWLTEIANSGTGGKHEDTKDGAHIVCKYRFARPIIQRDMPEHWEFINALEKEYANKPDALMYIADKFITTTEFSVSQMSEYMTDIERYYQGKGVRLTIPDDGLLEYAETVA